MVSYYQVVCRTTQAAISLFLIYFLFPQAIFAESLQVPVQPMVLKIMVIYIAHRISTRINVHAFAIFQKIKLGPGGEYQLLLSDLVRQSRYVLLRNDALRDFTSNIPQLPALLRIFEYNVESSQVMIAGFEEKYR